jgi:hypothetical protein
MSDCGKQFAAAVAATAKQRSAHPAAMQCDHASRTDASTVARARASRRSMSPFDRSGAQGVIGRRRIAARVRPRRRARVRDRHRCPAAAGLVHRSLSSPATG